MTVLSAREASVFACVADTLLAPAPPLPPVRETDAVAAFDAWLARSPPVNRLAVRSVLLGLALARWRRLPPTQRLVWLTRLGRPVLEGLRASAAISYYGDAEVSALLGYVPLRERRR